MTNQVINTWAHPNTLANRTRTRGLNLTTTRFFRCYEVSHRIHALTLAGAYVTITGRRENSEKLDL